MIVDKDCTMSFVGLEPVSSLRIISLIVLTQLTQLTQVGQSSTIRTLGEEQAVLLRIYSRNQNAQRTRSLVPFPSICYLMNVEGERSEYSVMMV